MNDFLQNLKNRMPAQSMFFWSAVCFLFLQPLPHVTVLKSVVSVWMAVSAIGLLHGGKLCIDWRSPLILGLSATIFAICISIVLSPYALESLDAFRKELLSPMLALVILLCFARSERKFPSFVIGAITIGFVLRTVLVLSEWHSIEAGLRVDSTWVKGYATEAAMYTPFLIAALLYSQNKIGRFFIGLVLVAEVLILIKYQTRTVLVGIAVSVAFATILARGWRMLALMVGAFAIMLFVSARSYSGLDVRYESMFQKDSYSGATGAGGRYPIWAGLSEIIEKRPLAGYGFGWKKLATVAETDGFVARWKSSSEPLYQNAGEYFSRSSGTVNPHNLPLQILFEVGIVGLIAYIFLWLAAVKICYRIRRSMRQNFTPGRFTACAGIAFLFSWGITNLANGLWPMPGPIVGLIYLLEYERLNLQ